MTTLGGYAKRFAPSFTLRRRARIDALIDALQHQGTLKRAAYIHMPALVELEIEETLWMIWGELGAASSAKDGLERQSDEVRASFRSALGVAANRLLERIPRAKSEKAGLSMLTALAGVTGEPEAKRLLEDLHDNDGGLPVLAALARALGWQKGQRVYEEYAGCFDHACPRCAAAMLIARRGPGLELRWGAKRVSVSAPTGEPELPGAMLARGAALLQFPNLRPALGAAFGPLECLRCAHRHRIIDKRPVGPSMPTRRRAEAVSGEATLEMPSEVQAKIFARLLEIERARSKDELRLAGVGVFGVSHGRQWPAGMLVSTANPATVARLPESVMCSFRSERPLIALVNDEDVSSPVPSDAPEIDAFAERILSAFETCDVVNVPDLIRLHIRTIDARRSAQIDGEPTIVPRRRTIAFELASELKQALESKRLRLT
jgi:nucleoid DNA-binding protein